jgi:diadenosine tetraphosphate (Ap4A) HIT family hydrolase
MDDLNKHQTSTRNTVCPFCKPDGDREILAESASAYAIFDKYPVNEGHALVIPKMHYENYFDLTIEEQIECITMINKVRDILLIRFNPDGFNIGINVGESAGQTVNHVHIHVIPRYDGDVTDPRGGVRGVIPDKQKY